MKKLMLPMKRSKNYLKTRHGTISSGMSVLKVFFVANELARMMSLTLTHRALTSQFVRIGVLLVGVSVGCDQKGPSIFL